MIILATSTKKQLANFMVLEKSLNSKLNGHTCCCIYASTLLFNSTQSRTQTKNVCVKFGLRNCICITANDLRNCFAEQAATLLRPVV